MSLFESLKSKIEGKKIKLVFPEGEEERILRAAVKLAEDNLAEPILLGDVELIKTLATKLNLKIEGIGIKLLDPKAYAETDFAEMKAAFVERRKGKNTPEQADSMLQDVNYFGTMLVYMGLAEGMVSGAVHATGDTVRPALQIIKTKPGVSRTSGAFIMTRNNDTEKYLFSDAAISINPTAQELAEMAIESIKTARIFDIDPKVAMLSFSTKGSAQAPEVSKVAEATAIAQQLAPDEAIDGELQFDAAFVPSVGAQKAPDSKVAGQANVFIFPELQSGNIGYKIAQRLGGFEAIGPILQGLNQPVSDLSRGANVEEIYKVGITTAAQSLE
ncbi:phosphate acetyltransferase [Dellaglioa sp. BT-FLS60]